MHQMIKNIITICIFLKKMHTFDNIKNIFQDLIQVCAICVKLTNHKAIRPFPFMNGHYLHILCKSMTQVGVLHGGK